MPTVKTALVFLGPQLSYIGKIHSKDGIHNSMSPDRELPFKVATGWQQLVSRPEVAKWLERELQALVLQADVGLIHSVVTSAMQSAPQVCHTSDCG